MPCGHSSRGPSGSPAASATVPTGRYDTRTWAARTVARSSRNAKYASESSAAATAAGRPGSACRRTSAGASARAATTSMPSQNTAATEVGKNRPNRLVRVSVLPSPSAIRPTSPSTRPALRSSTTSRPLTSSPTMP